MAIYNAALEYYNNLTDENKTVRMYPITYKIYTLFADLSIQEMKQLSTIFTELESMGLGELANLNLKDYVETFRDNQPRQL